MREPRRDDPSETFGPYVLFECLGRGGMATVHRAKQTGIEGFERPVALKRMLPWLTSDPEFVKSFVREARLAAQLRHTHIAQTYDLGKVDGIYYIAMELIVGRDLREILRQAHNAVGPVPVPIAINILFQICDALDYAHNFRDEQGRQLGLVHRDISPANVIVGEDGCAKIVDFGVAKGSTATLHTQSGMLKGKFAYMAPEMLQGQLDARCDLFAVGVVAWELLTAKPLFAGGDDMEILQRVTSWDPPPPSSINPMVPRELDAWVQMALAKNAQRRFQTAAQMRAGLELVARVPSMRATGPDVAAWIQWAFQQKRGQVGEAPLPMAQQALAQQQQQEAAAAPAATPRPGTPAPRPGTPAPAPARSQPDSRPPTVRVGLGSVSGQQPAQTLLVDDGEVIESKMVSIVQDPTTQPGHPGIAAAHAPHAPHPTPAPQPHPTPVPQARPTPAPQPATTPHPPRPGGHPRPHPAPTGAPVAPMASSPSGAIRAQRPSGAPPVGGPHATMIGAPIPVAINSAASSRYGSATAPPPPSISPATVPPPLNTPPAIAVQPGYTPHGIAAQHTPHGMPAQHTPHGMPAQHTPHGMPAQHTPHGLPVQHTPHGIAAQHTPHGIAAQHTPHGIAAQHTPHGVPVQHTPHGMPAQQGPQHTPQGVAANAPIRLAEQAGASSGAATISLGDGDAPPPGTPAWAMQPRAANPLQSPEYLQAAAAYGTEHARGTREPALAAAAAAPAPVPADLTAPVTAAAKKGKGGIFLVVLLCAGATVGGFFLVQHFL